MSLVASLSNSNSKGFIKSETPMLGSLLNRPRKHLDTREVSPEAMMVSNNVSELVLLSIGDVFLSLHTSFFSTDVIHKKCYQVNS